MDVSFFKYILFRELAKTYKGPKTCVEKQMNEVRITSSDLIWFSTQVLGYNLHS